MLISDLGESSWGQEHVRAEGEERDLLMLFRYGHGPILYALYRVEVPYLSAFHDFSCYLTKKNTRRQVSFHPVLELPASLYPMGMSCVELHNSLYFIGGHFDSAENDKVKFPASNVYVFDPEHPYFEEGEITSGYVNASFLTSCLCAKLIRAKPFPYAFVAMEKIFVIDNLGECDHESYFEVLDPNDKENCVELPSPPVGFVISGHAVVGDKIFLNGYGRGRIGHVICFDAETNQWMQDFIQDFSYGHMFLGEAQLVGDTIYAVAGHKFSTPAAYKLSSERLQYNLDECAAMNSECRLDERVTDLFDECAFLCPHSLEEVHQLVSYNWLGAMIVHMGDGVFCYMRSGKFPHESCHEYTGVVLAFFKPHAEAAFTETVNHTTGFFSGQFLHSAQLKFQGSRPGGTVSLVRCFSIPKGRNRAQNKRQVVGKEMIESRGRCIQLLQKQLLEVGFMGTENGWKNLSAGWDEYLLNLHKEGRKAMEKLRGGDSSGRKDALKFKKEVEKALRYATYLRQIWEIKLPESAEEVFFSRTDERHLITGEEKFSVADFLVTFHVAC